MRNGWRQRTLNGRVLTIATVAVTALSGMSGLTTSVTSGLTRPANRSGAVARSPWQAGRWLAGGASQTLADVAAVIGSQSSKASGLNGYGVGVALVDTGVVPVMGLNAARIVNGPDLSFESQSPSLRYLDTFGHGTHIAGIIEGDFQSVSLKGIATGAKLTSVKVAAADGSTDVSQMIAAIDWVVAHRNDDTTYPIRVLNLSYGTDSTQIYQNDPLAYAVEQAWKAGIVVVVAAGNRGNATAQLDNPAYDPNVIAVGSVATNGTATRTDDRLSDFTSLGSARTADILAPGESILSLRNTGSYVDVNYPSAVSGQLFKGSGTSQAAAVVSGAVALMLQKRPKLTPDQVKAILKATAVPLTTAVPGAAGLGELDASAAVGAPIPTKLQQWPPATGRGSLEATRGSSHVVHGAVALTGENSVWGPLDLTTWSTASAAHTSWQGGRWMGVQIAGDDWSGSSWASRTWAPATWSNKLWDGTTSWSDSTWSGHLWSSQGWTGRYWSGVYTSTG